MTLLVSSLESKPLRTMPFEVLVSTLQLRRDLPGWLFRAIQFAYRKLTDWFSALVCAAPLAWFFAFSLGPSSLNETRLIATTWLAMVFLFCVGYHVLELIMVVPLRDRQYPVLLRKSETRDFLYRLCWASG